MKWTDDRSENVDDRRGSGGIGGKTLGGGLVGIIIAAVVFFLGGDPTAVLQSNMGTSIEQTQSRQLSSEELKVQNLISMLTAENEQTWQQIFQEIGKSYRPAKVVLFEHATQSACGTAQAAMGPFYCPNDETVYMDMSFFNELHNKFGAEVTSFSVAYVLAHEMGHHIQNLLGILEQTDRMRRSGSYSEVEINKQSVATELQADFFAGLWARYTQNRENFLDPGDIDVALNAAEAVGDDNIMKRSQGYVVQEAFTHGSSAQRKEWFLKGFETGDIRQGNTFEKLFR